MCAYLIFFQRALNRKKMTASEFSNKENSESSTEHDKENSFNKTEPRRVKIFDGGQVLYFVY